MCRSCFPLVDAVSCMFHAVFFKAFIPFDHITFSIKGCITCFNSYTVYIESAHIKN